MLFRNILVVFIFCISLLPQRGFAEFSEVSTPESITTQIIKPGDTAIPYAVSGEAIVNLITSMVDFDTSGSTIIFNRMTGQIVVKNTPSNLSRVEMLLSKLREASIRQVEIEARIVTVTSDDINSLGLEALDLDIASTFNHGKSLFTSGESGTYEIAFPDVVTRTDADTFFGQEYSLGIFNNDISFEAVIDSLESRAEVNTVSAPNITVFNNQRAHIKITTHTTFVSEVDGDIESSGENLFFTIDTTTRRAPAGTILDVTPTINHDGTITLTLHPSFVRADLTETIAFSTFSQISNDGSSTTLSSNAANTLTLPEFTEQSIDTTVVIQDGGVAVLGGLIDEIETKTVNGIPLLQSIPYLGKFFQNEQNRDEKTHLLIFVKATSKYVDTGGRIKR